jgi:hypothetical protein
VGAAGGCATSVGQGVIVSVGTTIIGVTVSVDNGSTVEVIASSEGCGGTVWVGTRFVGFSGEGEAAGVDTARRLHAARLKTSMLHAAVARIFTFMALTYVCCGRKLPDRMFLYALILPQRAGCKPG